MELNYKKIQEINNPSLYLCNPNQTELCEIIPETASITLRLNDISELTLTVNKYVSGYNQDKQIQPCFDLLESKRLIKVECIGWFEIKNVSDNDGESGAVKTITAQSHQCTLRDKGFYAYDSVYKFYNSEDPYDDLFDANELESIPSVCGQLYKQLGIKLDLSESETFPTNDYGEWTIIYIDDKLRFNEDNIYRTIQSETTNGYDFMINTVEKAFEVLWLFDFLTHSIKVKYISSITQPTNIYLSYDNLIQNIETIENSENIVTVLNCNGGNGLDISSVNPMGTSYIVNFDYYKNTEWMSQKLIDVLDQWKTEYDSKVSDFSELVTQLYDNYLKISEYDNDIQYEELKIKSLTDGRDLLIQDSPLLLETVMSGENSKCSSSKYYTEAFPASVKANYYKKPFNYSKGVFSPEGDYVNDWGDEAIQKGYFYFSDGDNSSYCKFINIGTTTNINCGFERYGCCPENTDNCYNIDENSAMMLAAESIQDGKKSLYENSYYWYESEFLIDNIDENIFLGLKTPPRHNQVYEEDEIMYGTLQTLAENEYYYFVDGDSDGQYCKINVSVTNVDAETKKETYSVTGFTRYVILNKANEWINKHDKALKVLKDSKTSALDTIDKISQQMKDISEACNIQKFVHANDTDGSLEKELQAYWSEGDYTNDAYAMTDSMTIADGIDLSKQLKEAGEQQIKKVAQPKFSFNITTLDFLKLKDFQTFAEQLELGKTICVEKADGLIYNPAITEITFNLYNGDDFSMTFSNSARLNGNEFTFADLVAESSSVSKSVSSNWQDLLSYAKEKEKLTSLIANPLDRALRAGMGGAINQEFIVDDTGILGRKYTDNAHTSFSSEQLRMINNLILFTDDNWESAKTALGKIYYTDDGEEKSAYGLVAQTIIGDLIMSNTLKIKNSENDSESTILLNKDGITIKGSDNTALFHADTSGNVSITGQINATSGYIGDRESGFVIGSSTLSNSLDNVDERVYISTGTDGATYSVANSGDRIGWMLLAGNSFGVTKYGGLYATKGKLGNIIINEYGLRGNDFCLYDDNKVNGGGVLGLGSWTSSNVFTANVLLSKSGISAPNAGFYVDGRGVIVDSLMFPSYKPADEEKESGHPGIYIQDGSINSTPYKDNVKKVRLKFSGTSNKILVSGHLCPCTEVTLGEDSSTTAGYLGASGNPWSGWGDWDDGSDARIKKNIKALDKIEQCTDLFDALRPVEYEYIPGSGYPNDGANFGFIAQDVGDALDCAGLKKEDYAIYVDDTPNGGILGLKYTQFIALNTNEIQKLKKRVTELEQKLNEYTSKEGE